MRKREKRRHPIQCYKLPSVIQNKRLSLTLLEYGSAEFDKSYAEEDVLMKFEGLVNDWRDCFQALQRFVVMPGLHFLLQSARIRPVHWSILRSLQYGRLRGPVPQSDCYGDSSGEEARSKHLRDGKRPSAKRESSSIASIHHVCSNVL